ncbi:hypothetical protein [Enhygromyxa salina]|uniref:hypothetical protein n=1 Tax=Enhygromyxa salina TaxID=215803 RepID=UPI000D093A28|nr:hypothetical protein [Enhygromyxa salina]
MYELQRAVGLAVGLAKVGPAQREPVSHELLVRLGVLERLPSRWPDSPRLDALPWGAVTSRPPSPVLPLSLDGPWPQSPIVDPGFSPPVLQVPPDERQLHRRYNVLRYLGQVTALTPIAAAQALQGPRAVAVDDERFRELLNATSFSQFIVALDGDDREVFADELAEYPATPPSAWAKIDASVVDPGFALPGVHVAPTRTLLRWDGQRFCPLAIHFEDRPRATFSPTDGAAWELARYFVLQGLQHLLVLVFHPRLHFPGDTISAITQTVLPQGHRLARLLAPHLRFGLGLDEAVIHHRRSVLHNSQRELYTPFPLTTEGTHRGVVQGMRGVPAKAAFPAYRFDAELLDARTPYGRFRRDWRALTRAFVAEVLDDLPADDEDVCRWADAIAPWVPGFPDGEAIRRGGALVDTVTTHLTRTSVFHTADHHSYAGIPINELPWRLRVPPPNVLRPAHVELDALCSVEDYFRHRLCHAMFFAPVVLEPLSRVRYGFHRPRLRAARREFVANMDELDSRWAGSTFPASAEISAGIQY